MNTPVALQPIDAVDLTILVDNAVDMLVPGTEFAERPPTTWDSLERELRAEHGFSAALRIHQGERQARLLYDVGLGRDTAVHNMEMLGVDPHEFQAVVLSHGHRDHHGGLAAFAPRVGRTAMPMVVHPHAWRERKAVFPNGTELHLPPPHRQDLEREGWQIMDETGHSLLFEGMVLVTGQVERVTDFEKGFPLQQALLDGEWQPDPLVCDDQALVLHLGGKGLVVVSSCSHSGTCNVVRHAQRLTGVDRVHAFVGGMHLTGGANEAIISRTVEEMAAISPAVVLAGHCTGTKAIHALANAFPEAYVPTNVGTTYHFRAG